MATFTIAQLIAEIQTLLAWVPGLKVRATFDGQIIYEDTTDLEVLDADEAIEWALELAILHDDVVANPSLYHIDTLAAHGVMIPQDHPQRAEVVGTCAAEVSADCTGEGTAYAGRCLPCDLELAAQEEWMEMQVSGRY